MYMVHHWLPMPWWISGTNTLVPHKCPRIDLWACRFFTDSLTSCPKSKLPQKKIVHHCLKWNVDYETGTIRSLISQSPFRMTVPLWTQQIWKAHYLNLVSRSFCDRFSDFLFSIHCCLVWFQSRKPKIQVSVIIPQVHQENKVARQKIKKQHKKNCTDHDSQKWMDCWYCSLHYGGHMFGLLCYSMRCSFVLELHCCPSHIMDC